MRTIVRAIAPTIYQRRSVAAFGNATETKSGAYIFEQEFDSKEAAKDYLKGRAHLWADTEEEYHTLCEQVDNGYLELDAVMGYILEA